MPESCVLRSARGQTSVFVVDAENKVNQRTVRVAERSGHNVIISEGLSEGELLIVDGLRQLKEGDLVQTHPVNPGQAMKKR